MDDVGVQEVVQKQKHLPLESGLALGIRGLMTFERNTTKRRRQWRLLLASCGC